jgi:SET domain-containing protein
MGHNQAILDSLSLVSAALTTERLAVVAIPGKGRGVLARQAFAVGDVIEVVPVLVVEDGDILDQTPLANYVYKWPTSETAVAVAFGYGSIYNHSYAPNARYDKFASGESAGTIRYTAIKPIAVGEEIIINYNGDPADQSPMWFELAPTT